jgi:UPF0755 protein
MSNDQHEIGVSAEHTPPPKKRLVWWLKLLFALVFLAVLLMAATALAGYLLYDHITQPRQGGEVIEFFVHEGATGNEVGALLAQQGFLEHEVFFKIAIRLTPSSDTIRHGTFELPKGESAVQLLTRLRTEKPKIIAPTTVKITMPEGLSLAQMAQTRTDPEAFLAAVKAIDAQATFGVNTSSIEGFLMPNTYFFAEEPSEEELVQRMVEQFQKDYTTLMQQYPSKISENPIEVLTIASLIEEEARLDEERALVSAVIHNRLKKNMRLEMDSTLQYSLGKYGQRLLNSDKAVDSPYNTYMHSGLPPGPISNPGVKSIEAALHPAEVDYIFFVSNADGNTHTFSATLREHNVAVAKFRREIKEQRKQQQ